ncbi:MAG TPA: gentisate 1,2-dioxygenase [Burkholderiales bacterium]|jgi:gentisate 1,2-dioxygenase|nr:gentisate 1,2-dioxygenase [Burkholderiales bacterium]
MSSTPVNSNRERFSSELAALGMKPLWERTMRLAPGTAAAPVIWRWADAQPHLMRAAELITTQEAERRVLMLENPALQGTTFATTTLYAGLQVILPGEIARTHRHAPNALRMIVEGEGAYTAVEGERVMMRPGDFVTTPGWTWHDHGNLGSEPVVWLDGLDTAFANLFGAHFREDYPQESQPVTRRNGDAGARYGANLLPLEYRPRGGGSPLLSYPYDRTREALERLAASGDPHSCHGYKLRYVNPGTGGHPFPTMAVCMQWLPAGFSGRRYRSTDGAVFCVVEGRGRVAVGSTSLAFSPHDVFVVPSWEFHQLQADTATVLFSYTDRAAQEALGFWREEAGS